MADSHLWSAWNSWGPTAGTQGCGEMCGERVKEGSCCWGGSAWLLHTWGAMEVMKQVEKQPGAEGPVGCAPLGLPGSFCPCMVRLGGHQSPQKCQAGSKRACQRPRTEVGMLLGLCGAQDRAELLVPAALMLPASERCSRSSVALGWSFSRTQLLGGGAAEITPDNTAGKGQGRGDGGRGQEGGCNKWLPGSERRQERQGPGGEGAARTAWDRKQGKCGGEGIPAAPC